MNQFIEVTVRGQRVLVNLDHVEEIREGYGECVIYYAFNSPEAVEQNYIKPDQSYDEVIGMITDIGRYKPQLASDDVGKISAVDLLTAVADTCKNNQGDPDVNDGCANCEVSDFCFLVPRTRSKADARHIVEIVDKCVREHTANADKEARE